MIGMSQQKYPSAHGNNAFSARSSSFVPALSCQCGIVWNSRHLRVFEDVISLQNALLIAPWLLTHGLQDKTLIPAQGPSLTMMVCMAPAVRTAPNSKSQTV